MATSQKYTRSNEYITDRDLWILMSCWGRCFPTQLIRNFDPLVISALIVDEIDNKGPRIRISHLQRLVLKMLQIYMQACDYLGEQQSKRKQLQRKRAINAAVDHGVRMKGAFISKAAAGLEISVERGDIEREVADRILESKKAETVHLNRPVKEKKRRVLSDQEVEKLTRKLLGKIASSTTATADAVRPLLERLLNEEVAKRNRSQPQTPQIKTE